MPKLPLKPEGEPRGEVPAAEAPAEPSREELEHAKEKMKKAIERETTPDSPKSLIERRKKQLEGAKEYFQKQQEKMTELEGRVLHDAPPNVQQVYERFQRAYGNKMTEIHKAFLAAFEEIDGVRNKTGADLAFSEGMVQQEEKKQQQVEGEQTKKEAAVGFVSPGIEVKGRLNDVDQRANFLALKRSRLAEAPLNESEARQQFDENATVLVRAIFDLNERQRIRQILDLQKDKLVNESHGNSEVLLLKMETLVDVQLREPDLLRKQYKQLMEAMNDVSPKQRQTESSPVNSQANIEFVERYNAAFHPDQTDLARAKNMFSVEMAQKFGLS